MPFESRGPCKEVRSQCDIFWQETAIAAISNAGKAKHSALRRAIWVVVFCVFSGITLSGVVEVFEKFLKYPTSTSLSIELVNTVNTVKILIVKFWIYIQHNK